MPLPARLFLLATAALCTAVLAWAGLYFGCAVEPGRCGPVLTGFWVAIGLVFAAPFWLPAVVPARFPGASRIARRLGALGSLVPLAVFGSVVHSQLDRVSESSTLLPAGLLAGVCLLAVVVLLWSDLAAMRSRST